MAAEGGSSYRFAVPDIPSEDGARLEREWNALRTQEYLEIVEECETKFEREVAFEIFRENLTAGEAEEIEADLDKLRAWIARVGERDVFAAPGRDRAEAAIAKCSELLDDFVERVFHAEQEQGPSLAPPRDLPWGETAAGDEPAAGPPPGGQPAAGPPQRGEPAPGPPQRGS